MSPKKFSSILRLRKAIASYEPGKSLTDVALTAGYYDQAHFIRDFRAFSADDGLYFAANTGGYWKNDSFIAIPDALQVSCRTVSGGAVYAAGLNQSIDITYWVGNIENDLGSTYGHARYPDQSLDFMK